MAKVGENLSLQKVEPRVDVKNKFFEDKYNLNYFKGPCGRAKITVEVQGALQREVVASKACDTSDLRSFPSITNCFFSSF